MTPAARSGQRCPGVTVHPPGSHISCWVEMIFALDKGIVVLILHGQHLEKSTLIAAVLKEMCVVQ